MAPIPEGLLTSGNTFHEADVPKPKAKETKLFSLDPEFATDCKEEIVLHLANRNPTSD